MSGLIHNVKQTNHVFFVIILQFGEVVGEVLTLRNSTVVDNSDQGFLGSGDETAIEYNKFKNNGFARAIFNSMIAFFFVKINPLDKYLYL